MLYKVLEVPKDCFVKVTQGFTAKSMSLCHSHFNYTLAFYSLPINIKKFYIVISWNLCVLYGS